MPGAVFLEDVIRGKCCCLRCGCRTAMWLVHVCATWMLLVLGASANSDRGCDSDLSARVNCV
jgi:hypothetical protein